MLTSTTISMMIAKTFQIYIAAKTGIGIYKMVKTGLTLKKSTKVNKLKKENKINIIKFY